MTMEISSVQKLCLHLISSAFQRCRLSEDLCRLSVVLNCSPATDHPTIRISISDTATGSCPEDFQDLKYTTEVGGAEKWDGVLSVRTTSFSDDEIHHYHINLKENISNKRLMRMPSRSKNGAKFSGTEVSLSISESIDIVLAKINNFFQKMLILKIPNVTIDLVVEQADVPGSRYENFFLASGCNILPLSASNIEHLKSGFEDYVLMHGNSLNNPCYSCFPSRDHLKVGSGTACYTDGHKSVGLMMDAVIVISELLESTSPCCRSHGAKTEVLYFKDFLPASMTQSSLNALTSIDWKSYGLTLASAVDQGGYTLLEWGNFPSHAQIDIVLHYYDKKTMTPPVRHKTQPDRNLLKRAIKLALDDLKEKHEGILLSAHALKICSYAPDLARTITGLILSSNDSEFQGECFSLLGLQSPKIGGEVVEDCIKEKIISVIGMNDRKSHKSQEAGPLLFEDDCMEDLHFQDEDHEGKDMYSSLD